MNVNSICIKENYTIKEALERLDETAQKILLVEENMILKGVITDGDIRRWILANGDLNDSVVQIMNEEPITVLIGKEHQIKSLMREKNIEAVPIVSEENKIIDVIFWNDRFKEKKIRNELIDHPVVIMAGGKGSRLMPFTTVFPKPLIPIGEKPIVERIIDRFKRFGCNDFYLTVNYKKEMIKAYFHERHVNYELGFIEESKPLGTGGSLSLLKGVINKPFFVSNCDILINGDYSEMLKYHMENNNKITLITSMKYIKIPYGVIELNKNGTIKNITEKPEYDQLVNTGMYILDPDVLSDIPHNEFFHITDLIIKYLEKGEKVGTYPVSNNSWLDMGEFDKMEEMIRKLGI